MPSTQLALWWVCAALVNIVMSALSDIKGNGHMTDNIALGTVTFL